MSTELVNISNANSIAPSFGGSGVFDDPTQFKARPSNIELVQGTTRAEGAIPGQFRVASTGEHFKEFRAVLLFMPQEKRSMFASKSGFGSSSPLCYSNDGLKPSERAEQPQALSCKNCRNSDWTKFNQTKNSDDKPKCSNRLELAIVERETKLPYKLILRGMSMKKWLGAKNETGLKDKMYMQALKFKAENGRSPELYDFSFLVKANRKVNNAGTFYEVELTDLGLIKEEDRGEFGALFAQFDAERRSYANRGAINEASEELEQEMTESAPPAAAVYNAPKTTSNIEVEI